MVKLGSLAILDTIRRFTVIYIICCLYTYVNFLFGNILSVVNVYSVRAVPAQMLSLTED